MSPVHILPYNESNSSLNFRSFLLTGNNLSKSTMKNYLSDARHFLGWLGLNKSNINLKERLVGLEKNSLNDYFLYLRKQNVPINTINRRLSALRKFFSYLLTCGWRQDMP